MVAVMIGRYVLLRFVLLVLAVITAAAVIPPLLVRQAFGQTYVGPLQRTELPPANRLMMSTGKSLEGITPGAGLTLSGGSLTANVASVMGRTGDVALLAGDITTAIGYTPMNRAGDTVTGFLGLNTAASLSAAGTTAGTATVLTAQHSIVTSVAVGTGVRLPTGLAPGVELLVANRGANTLTVYPPAGAQIEAFGTDVPVGVAAGGHATFRCATSTQCYAGS